MRWQANSSNNHTVTTPLKVTFSRKVNRCKWDSQLPTNACTIRKWQPYKTNVNTPRRGDNSEMSAHFVIIDSSFWPTLIWGRHSRRLGKKIMENDKMENVSLNNLMLRCFQWHQQAYVIGTSMPTTARLWEPTLWGAAVASYLVLLPPSPVLDRAPNTHHLGSTTEGTASELRAPWGRRFLGPRKRCTSSHRSIWMKKNGLPSLLFLHHILGVSSLVSSHY